MPTLFESSEKRFNQSRLSQTIYRHMFFWFIFILYLLKLPAPPRAALLDIPVEPHEAVAEVSKRLKLYNSEEHLPIESFVTTLIHWKFFLMTRTKLAFVGFVAAGNSMWHQVLDDLCLVVTDQSVTTWDSSYAPNSTQYNSVLQSTTPESTTPELLRTTKYYFVLVQYYSVLQSTTPVLLRPTKY